MTYDCLSTFSLRYVKIFTLQRHERSIYCHGAFQMITAAEALELTRVSEAHITKCMDILDMKIREAAKEGGRMFRASAMTVFDSVPLAGSIGPHEKIAVTPFQHHLIVALEKHGFIAKMEIYGEGYVPRGLADDDGNGPIYQNYALTVRW